MMLSVMLELDVTQQLVHDMMMQISKLIQTKQEQARQALPLTEN